MAAGMILYYNDKNIKLTNVVGIIYIVISKII
jgi:hypothetical protein